jgi:serine/threonine protein phosphatase PrpC
MLETREFKSSPKNVTASVMSDVGCVREANEDRGRHIKPTDKAIQQNRGALTIVADGMGGHASGEVASQMAIELISEFYYADTESETGAALHNAIQQANAEIFVASESDEELFGMGTTLIALVLLGDTAIAAHVGDSRLYRLRGDEMALLTMDHSQVMEMVKQGVLSIEEARNHDDKNVILRAVGTQKVVEIEISKEFKVDLNDEFLLCSDGLSDMLDDHQIRQIWIDAKDIHEASENLIQGAKDMGGHDNVTVAVVKVENGFEQKRIVPVTREIGGN